LTSSCGTKEEMSQKLLDFVTKDIKYDFDAHEEGVEQLKRPDEVLMTKKSDCSGKAILYASLLEQIGVDYRLIYFKGHISLAIEGDFKDNNSLSFSIGGKTFTMAEVTAKGFIIGDSILATPDGKLLRIKDMLYFQKPGLGSKIYDAKTGKPLQFT